MQFVAVLDTCVLYPIYLCDTLLRTARAAPYTPVWSADIIEELRRSLVRDGYPADLMNRRIAHMTRAFPSASINGYETHDATLTNHPKDRHVLAAAIQAGAEFIVTFNLRDFPDQALGPYGVVAVHPDDFMLERLETAERAVLDCLSRQTAGYGREPRTLPGLLSRLARSGLPRFAAEVATRVT